MKILIVDDDSISRKIMKAACEQLGHEVVTSTNGASAWGRFDKSPVRIVISDWVMPKVNGLALCQLIRMRPDTPYTFLFLISGVNTRLENYTEAMEAGVDDFIYKPVDVEVFRNQLALAEQVLRTRDTRGRPDLGVDICSKSTAY